MCIFNSSWSYSWGTNNRRMNRDPLLAQEAIGPEHWSSMWPLVHLPGKRLGDPAKVARNHAQWLPFSKDTVTSVIFRLLLYDDCWGKLVHTCSYIFITRVSFPLWGEKVKCYHDRKHGSVTSLKRCWKCRRPGPLRAGSILSHFFFLLSHWFFGIVFYWPVVQFCCSVSFGWRWNSG
jgi:hypothetical protein